MIYNIEDLLNEDKHKIKEEKKKGRPFVEEDKATYRIASYLTQEEAQKLIAKAKELKVSKSTLLRRAILDFLALG